MYNIDILYGVANEIQVKCFQQDLNNNQRDYKQMTYRG